MKKKMVRGEAGRSQMTRALKARLMSWGIYPGVNEKPLKIFFFSPTPH